MNFLEVPDYLNFLNSNLKTFKHFKKIVKLTVRGSVK